MPEFANPFSVLANDRKLTHAELVRAIRFLIASEFEAIQLYMQLAESTDNALATSVLKDIADEERVHVGEFLRLLHELEPEEAKFYAKGAQEVEEEIAEIAAEGKDADAPTAEEKVSQRIEAQSTESLATSSEAAVKAKTVETKKTASTSKKASATKPETATKPAAKAKKKAATSAS